MCSAQLFLVWMDLKAFLQKKPTNQKLHQSTKTQSMTGNEHNISIITDRH